MNKQLLSIALISSLIAPQSLLWAADSTAVAPATVITTPAPSLALKTDEEKLLEYNKEIKQLEGQLSDLHAEYHAAVRDGDTAKAEALKDQIEKTHKKLREAFNKRHDLRMDIHYVMVADHQSHVELHDNARELHHAEVMHRS